MKIESDRKQRPAVVSKLCICLLIVLIMAAAGCLTVTPNPVNENLNECQSFTTTFSPVGQVCPTGPFTYFYWLSGAPPAWVVLDENTGVLTACPPLGSVGVHNFSVGVTEMWPGPVPPPCATASPAAPVTLTVAAIVAPAPLTILDTFVMAWSMEGMPFYLPLSATGCSGNYTWSAVDLPPGLVLDPITGEITGVPPPGSAGIYNVTATVTDNFYTCADCCPPASRPFVLVIDSYGDYLGGIDYGSTYDFVVEIGPGLTAGATPVLIDGSPEATLGGNQSASFSAHPGEMHLTSVDQSVPGADPNVRYGVTGPHQILVSDTNLVAHYDYAVEVFIQTGSDPAGVSEPPGTGYHALGSSFTSSAASPVTISSLPDVKYVFKQWTLTDGSTSPWRDLSFNVSQAGNVKAVYDTYYQLTLKSDYPPVNETSWELKDSTASYNLALQPIPMNGFWGLLGGRMIAQNGSGTVLMTGPQTRVLTWAYDYTIPIIILAAIVLVIVGIVLLIVFLRKRSKAGAGGGIKTTTT
ncbi:MAG: Ig domain-containing protein [Dehalococcoidia bacterium]